MTADDFRISDIQKVRLNGRAALTFKAHQRDGDAFVFCGQFEAPPRTARRDLWRVAAGLESIKPLGAPVRLDDARTVKIVLDAPSRAKAKQIAETTSEAIRIALAAYPIQPE